MGFQNKKFNLIFFLTLAIILIWPFFIKAQESVTLNPIPSDSASRCLGSEAFANLNWTSTISGTPTYYILRKVQGEATFTEIGFTQNLFYTDRPIASDKNYVYQLKAVRGGDTFYSNEEIALAAYCPPVISPPTTSCESDGPYITLNWSSISGALSIYEIYRDNVKIGQTTTTNFTDGPNIEGTKTYNYFITAIWQNGTTRNSDTVPATALACPPTLTATTDCLINIAPGGPKVNLSWNSLLGVQKYQIYRKAQAEADYSLLADNLTETNYTDYLVESLKDTYFQGGQISYKVKAIWPNDEYADSTPKIIDIPRCPPFLKVESNCDEFSFRLSWTATGNATHYNIYRDGLFRYQNIGTAATSYTDYLDFTVCPGQICTFTYYIEAVVTGIPNIPSNSVTKDIDCATIVPPSPAPILAIPETLCVSGNSRISLSWTPSNNVIYYSLYRSGKIEPVDLIETSYTDSGIQSGYEYTYYVVARGKGGTYTNSENTQTIKAVDCTPPSTPILTLTTGCTNGQSYVDLSWTTTTNTLNYEIYKGTSATNLTLLTTLDKSVLTLRDTGGGVSPSTPYYYKVVAKGPTGVPSSSSDIKAINTQSCFPTTPVLTLSRACETGNPVVNLSWTTDRINTTRYEIFRQDYSATNPIKIIYDVATTTWKDTSVSPETTYNYKVEAVGYFDTQRSTQGYKSITTYNCSPPGPFTLNEPTPYCQVSSPRADLSWTASSNSTYYNLYRYRLNLDGSVAETTTFSGVTSPYADRGFGNALKFDGSNDYVNIEDSSSLHSDREITIGGWFYVNSFDKDWQSIYWKGNTPDCTTGCENREYALWLYKDGYLHFTSTPTNRVGVGQLTCNTPSGTISIGRWYHFATVISADGNYMRIYVNGEQKGSCSYNTSGIRDTTGPLRIGNNPWWNSHFNGTIDEVRLYNRALSAAEISDHSKGIYSDATDSTLVGLWHFDEGSGQFASDSSNYGNSGTLGSTAGSDANDPTWVTNGLQSGTRYRWRARAFGPGGNTYSNATNNYTMSTCSPTKPGLVLTSFCGAGTGLPEVNLRWSYTTATTKYEIYRQDKGLTPIKTINQGDPEFSSRTWTDNNAGAGLSEQTTYTYYIKAIGSTGLTNQSDSISILSPSCLAPTKPENLQATFSCSSSNPQVNLSWSPSQNTSYYTIYRNPSLFPFPVTTTATSYTDTAVNTNSTYSYYVIAYGPGGSSPPSDLVNITTGYCTPSTPSIKSLTTDCQNLAPINTISWLDPDVEARQIFYDGFEGGDFSKWSGVFQDDGITSIESIDPYQGTYHSQFKLNPVNNWDGYGGSYYNIPTTQTYLYLRAYYKFDSLPPEGYSHSFTMFLPQDWNNRSAVSLVRQGGQYFWQLFFNGTTTNSGPFIPQINTWYSVELYTRVGTVAGEAKVWIDGELKASLSGIDVSGDSRINQVRAWVYTNGPPGTERTFRIDSVIVSDRYIGPGTPIYNANQYKIYRNTTGNLPTEADLIKTIITTDPEFSSRNWKDNIGLSSSNPYNYWVKSVGPTGLESSLSAPKQILTYNCGIPTAPSLGDPPTVFCKNNLPYATFNWTTDPNATSYNLYRTNPDSSSYTYSTRTSPLTDKGSFALKFDGTDDYLQFPYSANLQPDAITIEFWIKLTSNPDVDTTLNNWRWLISPSGWQAPAFLILEQDRRINFNVYADGKSSRYIGGVFSGEQLTVGEWAHLVYVYDPITGGGYAYKNGQLSRSGNMIPGGGNLTKSTAGWRMSYPSGTAYPNGNGAIPGIIDEVRIYGRALTPTEISEHRQGIYKNEAELKGAWHFEEGEGTTLFDNSGQSNNGKIAGPAWVTSQIGKALEFRGLSYGYVEVPYSSILNSGYTVEAWIKPLGLVQDQTEGGIITKFNWGNYQGYRLLWENNKRVFFGVANGSSWKSAWSPTGSVPLDQWSHIVGRYDGSSVKIYVNGVERGSTSQTGDIALSTNPLRFGAESATYKRFNGLIDEVRIYNRALSATGPNEIAEHKNGIFNDENGLVGLWHFDEGSGNIAYDDSPFSNNGTLVKGAEWTVPPKTPPYSDYVYVSPLEGGKSYEYYVRAVGVKVESLDSNKIPIDAPSCLSTKPILTVTPLCEAGASQLKLSWQSDPYTQYWSVWKQREGDVLKFITDTTSTFDTDINIETGINYYYQVVAWGWGGEHTPSDLVGPTKAIFCYPQPYGGNPFSITAAPGCYGYSSRIKVEWPIDTTGNTISYNIWRKNTTLGEPDFTKIYSGLAATLTSYLDIVDEEQNYIYKVEAVGSGTGNTLFSNPSNGVTSFACSNLPPNPPGLKLNGVVSTGDLRAVFVEWRDVGNAEYYKLFRQGSPGWTEIVQKTGTQDGTTIISHADNTVSEGQTYDYQVIAYNLNGNTSSNIIPASVPIARPGDFTLSGSLIGNKVKLSWTKATTTVAGGPVTYKILRGNSTTNFPTTICTITCIDLDCTAPPLECYDNNPTGAERFYKAVATNNGGSTEAKCLSTGLNYCLIEFPLPIWREIPPW